MWSAVRLLAIVVTLALAGGETARASADFAMAGGAAMTDDGMADCSGSTLDASGMTLSCGLVCTPLAVATIPVGAAGGRSMRVAPPAASDPGPLPSVWTPSVDPSPPGARS